MDKEAIEEQLKIDLGEPRVNRVMVARPRAGHRL